MIAEKTAAFLIVAHDQPSHLQRLCRALSPVGDCYVHFDSSSGVVPSLPASATLLPAPIQVNHGGFSLTESMLLLLEAGLTNPNAEMFVFLSGRDYPIASSERIGQLLHEGRGTNFMNFYELGPDAELAHHASQYYFVDWRNRLPWQLRQTAFHSERVLRRIVPRRRFPLGHSIFRGSQWMTLCRSSAEFILGFRRTSTGEAYERFFRHSWGSDEMYFQTVLLNSAEAERCAGHADRQPTKNENKVYLHHIDWDPTREGPAVLDMRDLGPLVDSPKLFARKFDETRSSDLLNHLDAEYRLDAR